MVTAIKRLLIAILFSCTFYPVFASHLAGQDFTYIFLGDSSGFLHYRVSLSIYQDSINGNPGSIAQDNPAMLAVYTGAGVLVEAYNTVYYSSSISMPITASGSCDSGGTILPVGVLKKTFIQDYYLPPSATGYIVAYQRCCFNGNLVNIENAADAAMTATCTIPPSGIATYNNSALSTNYPPFVIAVNEPLVFDCSATDADGDSLTYELCESYNAPSPPMTGNTLPPPAPPPYEPETYVHPLSSSNPMNCSVPLGIDSVTGLLTGTPNILGRYLITVCCNEWRGGVLINKTQREFEFITADCLLPAEITAPEVIEGLYPNPATSEITVVSTNRIKQVTFCNVLGQRFDLPVTFGYALGGLTDEDEINVDISSLPAGVYFIKINGNAVKKFVKQLQHGQD